MRDLRFTGHINGDYIDVRFRTDMINDNDYCFNIVQEQTGIEFNTTDKQTNPYLKYFSNMFKETNNNIATAKQFAIDNALNLRMYGGKNGVISLVHDFSDSTSNRN